MDSFTRPVLMLSLACVAVAGCATPQYALRQTPVPEESAFAIEIERTISASQAREFERQGARAIGPTERLVGFEVQRIVDRLSHVTERPTLSYRAYLAHDNDPNAAALADGRIYLTTGLLNYLGNRGSKTDELAFVLGHEIAHTVAQHLVKRYRMLQQQELLMAIVSAGAAAATRNATGGLQQASQLAVNAASLLRDVANSGYSQEQELEADQLGIRYVIRAGFRPEAALDLLQDFSRFETPWPFLRTHPYIALRRAYLDRYLQEPSRVSQDASTPSRASTGAPSTTGRDERRKRLREIQRLYPSDSVSWQNLQRQIDSLQ